MEEWAFHDQPNPLGQAIKVEKSKSRGCDFIIPLNVSFLLIIYVVLTVMIFQVLFGGLTLSTAIGSAANANVNTNACYGSNVISTPSEDHRPVPWGTPSVHFSSLNGTLTTCCDSLDEIRTALDDIDDQILDLLNQLFVL